MNIRRLNPDETDLFHEVYSWDKDYPRWYRDMEKVAKFPLEKFIAEAPLRVDLGVFDDSLLALISVLRRAPQCFEAHIWAKRGSSVEGLAVIARWLIESLRKDLGMKFGFVWVAHFNLPIKKLCYSAGLIRDGAVEVSGVSHGRPIIWQRFSTGHSV